MTATDGLGPWLYLANADDMHDGHAIESE